MIDISKMAEAIQYIVNHNQIPPMELCTNPSYQNEHGMTAAMYIVFSMKQIPPTEWLHNPSIQSRYGDTVAMIIVHFLKQLPPPEWLHDPSIQTTETCTLSDYGEDIPNFPTDDEIRGIIYNRDKPRISMVIL